MAVRASDATTLWIMNYVKTNNWLTAVKTAFVDDPFNLTRLPEMVTRFRDAIRLILDKYETRDNLVLREAGLMYLLIHARYIITAAGLKQMLPAFEKQYYGVCPRGCDVAVMPHGMHDSFGKSNCTVMCPVCCEIYYPESTVLRTADGASFGSSFATFFFHTFTGTVLKLPELRDAAASLKNPADGYFKPTYFGYAVR